MTELVKITVQCDPVLFYLQIEMIGFKGLHNENQTPDVYSK
jgi:hypothetical protein